ncbi:MAG: hypothetical protein DMD40_00080 [Gemmatimonadetes bacterium]|nr:MAG: hypothetical protein DMD40_00080 [Gemmatimonadota bacterium]
MTFKHKLSRRLALLRNVVLLGGLTAVTGCDLRALLQGIVVTVSVLPAASNIGVGQTVQLTATARDANGSPVSGRAVTWTTNNPAIASVDGNGLVTGATAAPAAGAGYCEQSQRGQRNGQLGDALLYRGEQRSGTAGEL